MTQAEDIYQQIKNEIISGALPSDTALKEVDLSNRFHVSRTPVREALRRLASEKLIRTIPNAGSFVGAFTWKDAQEMFAIRQLLETYAGVLAASHITEEGVQKFEDLYSQMEKCAERMDSESYAQLDERFHELLNETGGNHLLVDTINTFNDRAKLARLRRISYAKGEIAQSMAQHRKIIDALKNHDQKKIGALMIEHGHSIFGDITQNHIKNVFEEDK